MRDDDMPEAVKEATDDFVASHGGDASEALEELRKTQERAVEDSDVFDDVETFSKSNTLITEAANLLQSIGEEGLRDLHEYSIRQAKALALDQRKESATIEMAEKKGEIMAEAARKLNELAVQNESE